MGFSLINTEGSGKAGELASYSYSEDVTSLEPGNLTGGTGQVNVTAVSIEAETDGATHPASKYLINNALQVIDDGRGFVEFRVKSLSESDGIISVTGETLMGRLNVERKAEAYGGAGASLLGALQYYTGLVDIFPIIDETFALELEEIEVNYIGWTGNVWEHLKMLCAVSPIPLEAYIDGADLIFRQAKTDVVDYSGNLSATSLVIESFEAAKEVEVFNYSTSYGVDEIVQEDERDVNLFPVIEKVSITDTMQVDAGTILTKRFTINASLESVNQPECVSAILPLPYTGGLGQYVIVGSDDLPVEPAQWLDQGGSLTVSLTENATEIEITVIAPPVENLPTAADENVSTTAPYKIGVESSGEAEYPALWITGTGVFYKKTSKKFVTGASNEYTSKTSAQQIDNPFIINAAIQSTSGVAAAQAVCGPRISLSQTSTLDSGFGSTIGKLQVVGSNKYRIATASYSPSDTSLTLTACASIADFNARWTGSTFADFTDVAFDPAVNPGQDLKFNEFTVTPLIGA